MLYFILFCTWFFVMCLMFFGFALLVGHFAVKYINDQKKSIVLIITSLFIISISLPAFFVASESYFKFARHICGYN